ncbi:MAG: hypothetical protein IJ646_12065 [Clostridia bacterium]|nr:hypothetical protein [Clostridia bacterium]
MENQLFRQKTLDRVSSPDQLQDYMRVTSPGIWLLLGAVVALLIGLIVLSSVGTLETTVNVEAEAAGDKLYVALPDARADEIKPGMTLRVGAQETKIEYVYENDQEEPFCTATLDVPDGSYDAVIVTEAISPIRFLLN